MSADVVLRHIAELIIRNKQANVMLDRTLCKEASWTEKVEMCKCTRLRSSGSPSCNICTKEALLCFAFELLRTEPGWIGLCQRRAGILAPDVIDSSTTHTDLTLDDIIVHTMPDTNGSNHSHIFVTFKRQTRPLPD